MKNRWWYWGRWFVLVSLSGLGFIITLNYVELPMVKKSPGGDITFPASIFTGALATFGLSTGNGKKQAKEKPKDMTKMDNTLKACCHPQ